MALEGTDIALIVGGTTIGIRLIENLMSWGEKRFGQGKRAAEDKSDTKGDVALLCQRIDQMFSMQKEDHPRVRDMEIEMAKAAVEIKSLASSVQVVALAQLDTQKYIRQTQHLLIKAYAPGGSTAEEAT